MNCWNHTDTPAVAQCIECKKFLCKECASKNMEKYDNQIICDECYQIALESWQEQIQKMEEAEAKKEKSSRRSCFIVTCCLLTFLLYFASSKISSGNEVSLTVKIQIIALMVWIASAPYGWRALRHFFEDRGRDDMFLVQLAFCLYIGFPCMIYHIFRYVIFGRVLSKSEKPEI